jgi:hypothetical protein
VTGSIALALGVLAQQTPKDTGPDFGKASPFGLLVIVLLLVGTALLVWSMNRHLRKLPKSFQSDEIGDIEEAAEAPDAKVDTDPPAKGTPGEPGG